MRLLSRNLPTEIKLEFKKAVVRRPFFVLAAVLNTTTLLGKFLAAYAIRDDFAEGVVMLRDFLLENEKEILEATEMKTLELAGARPSSAQLKSGLPIFYKQLLDVLTLEESKLSKVSEPDKKAMAQAAAESDEVKVARASTHPGDEALAEEAGLHGTELLRLGYTLSHVVHAYGSMCQSITDLASKKSAKITAEEFRDLNRCLDIAIAGAVTTYQELRSAQVSSHEVEHLGFLAHELRNALSTIKISLQLIKEGTVGFSGSTGQILDGGLERMEKLINSSLTEVRLRVDPEVHDEAVNLLELVEQIFVTGEIEAKSRQQILECQVDAELFVQGDGQLIYSAISNLIQNALKYSRNGGRVQVRSTVVGNNALIEVEDECGGLKDSAIDLFKAFEQQDENREGLGLGLAIAQKAVKLNRGRIDVQNIPGKGCIFRLVLPLAGKDFKAIEQYKIKSFKNENKNLNH